MELRDGLIVDPPTACGYIFVFEGEGNFHPSGKVAEPFTKEQVKEHNRLLAEMEWTRMLESGKGILYLTWPAFESTPAGRRWKTSDIKINDWPSVHVLTSETTRVYGKHSDHNMAGRNGRTDVWFDLDGSTWHGVNIGDNQILRVKRTKKG